MRRPLWAGLSCAVLGLALVSCNDALDGSEQFMVQLSGANEVQRNAFLSSLQNLKRQARLVEALLDELRPAASTFAPLAA